MDEQVTERIIRQLSSGYGYRFPDECVRCRRRFEPRMISAIERAVLYGKTIMESIQSIRHDRVSHEYVNPWESNYSPQTQALALGPRDICCRMSIISPHVFPTGTIVSHVREKPIVGPTVKTDADAMDFFDYMEKSERPEMVIDEEHGDIRLYIEDGIVGFEPPILWEELE
jgi:hypothetical protein